MTAARRGEVRGAKWSDIDTLVRRGTALLIAHRAVWIDRPARPPLGCRLSFPVGCSGLKCPKVRNRLFFSRPSSEDPHLCAFRGFYYGVGATLWDDAIGCHAGVWHGMANRPIGQGGSCIAKMLFARRTRLVPLRAATGSRPIRGPAKKSPAVNVDLGRGEIRLQFGPSPGGRVAPPPRE